MCFIQNIGQGQTLGLFNNGQEVGQLMAIAETRGKSVTLIFSRAAEKAREDKINGGNHFLQQAEEPFRYFCCSMESQESQPGSE